MSGIMEEKRVTTLVISLWVYLHWCIYISSVTNPAVRSRMLLQSGQSGCECWTPGKSRKCHQWNVSKSRLGGRKLGLWCVPPLHMNRLAWGSHPSFHGGSKNLMYMHVHEFERAMFENKVEYGRDYMGRWTVCG